tara:strand:- start:1890 stop:3197 length:1308 start_codon:yes stop_codon:yes gene_type:complete
MPLKIIFNEFNDDEDGLKFYVSSTPMDVNSLPTPVDETSDSSTLTDESSEHGANAVSHIVSWDETQSAYVRVSAVKASAEVASQEFYFDAEGGGGDPEPTGDIIGVVLVSPSVKGGDLVHIDVDGNTITSPGTAAFDGMYPWSDIADETIDGQAMVKIPKFYYKRGPVVGGEHDGRDAWWISPEPATGFTVHPAFVLDGSEVDQFWYGKYQGSIDGASKLASVAGVTPSTSRSITQYFDDAELRNVAGVEGFRIIHIDMLSAIQWMALIEAASFDSQTVYGTGLNSSSSPEDVDSTANQDAAYRGIIGAWGNIYQRIDGLRMNGGNYERRSYEVGSLTTGWSSTGISPVETNSALNPVTLKTDAAIEDLFIADTTAASESDVTIPDYTYYSSSSEKYASMGGGGTGGSPGLWTLLVDYSATHTNSFNGSRLARVV